MKKRKFKLIIIILLIVLVVPISAWPIYIELTRPSTPILAVENNIVSWVATGTGDMAAGRFIRSYEARIVTEDEIFVINVDGPTAIGEVMAIDLTTLNLANTDISEFYVEISVRTIRTLTFGTRVSRWSNTIVWSSI